MFDVHWFLFFDQTGCPLAGLRRAQPNRGRRSCESMSILTLKVGIEIVHVVVLVLETESGTKVVGFIPAF